MKSMLILLSLVLNPVTSAVAGGVPCQVDGSCTTEPTKFLSGSFCINQNNHITGYSFYGGDDAYLIDSFGVTHNSEIRFRVQQASKNTFFIEKMNITNNKILKVIGPFAVINDNKISLAKDVYTTAACKAL